MITLFIDTSSSDVSIAIYKDNMILSSITKNIPGGHSIYTVSFIEQLLKDNLLVPKDIERIMVVTGPGSFTGLRIGVTIAKVYAYLEKIEVIPISSLKMRSISFTHKNCLSLIDAHHDNYYVGLYDENNNDIMKEKFMKKDEVLEIIKKYKPTIVGDREGKIENISYPKKNLDIIKIINYYQNFDSINPHFLNPNYLKLPQAMEGKKND